GLNVTKSEITSWWAKSKFKNLHHSNFHKGGMSKWKKHFSSCARNVFTESGLSQLREKLGYQIYKEDFQRFPNPQKEEKFQEKAPLIDIYNRFATNISAYHSLSFTRFIISPQGNKLYYRDNLGIVDPEKLKIRAATLL